MFSKYPNQQCLALYIHARGFQSKITFTYTTPTIWYYQEDDLLPNAHTQRSKEVSKVKFHHSVHIDEISRRPLTSTCESLQQCLFQTWMVLLFQENTLFPPNLDLNRENPLPNIMLHPDLRIRLKNSPWRVSSLQPWIVKDPPTGTSSNGTARPWAHFPKAFNGDTFPGSRDIWPYTLDMLL